MARPDGDKLTLVDVLTYNGVTFPTYSGFLSFGNESVKTESGFKVAYNRFTMVCRSVFNAPDAASMDNLVGQLRSALMVQGAPLFIAGKAVGLIGVNFGNWPRDVMKGPEPKNIKHNLVGAGLTCEFDFTLEWSLPVCSPSFADQLASVLDFHYSVTYENDHGYTTRNMQGKLKVPQSLNGGIPSRSADAYMETITPPALPGFQRSYGPRVFSSDRSEMDFSVMDRELGINIPPPGCISPPEVSYRIESLVTAIAGSAGIRWMASLDGSYEVAKDGTMSDAVNAFRDVLRQKMFKCQQSGVNAGLAGNDAIPILLKFNASEESIYGHRVSRLFANWTFSSTLRGIIETSGLWTPVENSDWQAWQQSVYGSVFAPRGVAKLVFNIGADLQYSVCDQGIPTPQNDTSMAGILTPGVYVLKGQTFPVVTPATSWTYYRIWWEEERDNGQVVAMILPKTPVSKNDLLGATLRVKGQNYWNDTVNFVNELVGGAAGGLPINANNPAAGGGGLLQGGGVIENNVLKPNQMAVQRRARPFRIIYLCGQAMRFGFPIPEPGIDTVVVNNKELKVEYSPRPGMIEFQCLQQGNTPGFDQDPGLPVFIAKWRKRYLVRDDIPVGQLQMVGLPPGP